MIHVKLQGRLGNQMFQYATAFALAQRRATHVEVDTSNFHNRHNYPDFTLWQFKRLDLTSLSATTAMSRSIRRKFTQPAGMPVFKMSGLGFDERVINLPDNTSLEGYFQSVQYFVDFQDRIRFLFDLSPFFPQPIKQLFNSIRGNNRLVAVHIRRGDYVGNAMFDIDRESYYRRAMSLMAESKPSTYLIFSDDAEWCRSQSYLKSTGIVFAKDLALPSLTPIQELAMMAVCDDAITAGSTFSWWAAWLNQSRDKRVIIPARWLRDYSAEQCGLSVPGWTEL